MPPTTRRTSTSVRLSRLAVICWCLVFAVSVVTLSVSTTPKPLASNRQHKPSTDLKLATAGQRSNAERLMDDADNLRADWTKESLLEAINKYREATRLWTSALDYAHASQATLKCGDVYFVLSEYRAALTQFQNAETLARKSGDWLVTANVLSHMGRLQSSVGKNELAQQLLVKSLAYFKQHEANLDESSSNAYVEALNNLAEVSYAIGNFLKAQELLKRALELSKNNPNGEAKTHLLLGYITGSTGDSENAVTEISHALELYREGKNKLGEGRALTTLAIAHALKRESNLAIELHTEAINIFRTVGDRNSEAIALTGLGQVYESINELPVAMTQYQQALQLFEQIGSSDGLSVATFKIAAVLNQSGQPDQAVKFYERGVKLSRAAGQVRTEANAVNEIARIFAAQGRSKQALEQYQRIQKIFERIGDAQGQAITLNAHGEFLLQLGETQEALTIFRRALPLSEKSGDPAILISSLYDLARANLGVESPEVALGFIKRSLAIVEDMRANVASPDFRVSYFSGAARHYELCIKILMQLNRLHPEGNFAADALLVSEKARARLLLDLVTESRTKLRQGASPHLLERERELQGFFRAQAQYKMNLVLNKKSAEEIAAVDNQLAQLKAEYQQIQAELRRQYPGMLSFESSSQLDLQRIQDELKESDTMLLEFALGDERSFLWAVTSNSLQSFELPSRQTIEASASELYTLITARQGRKDQKDSYQATVEAADNAYFEKASQFSQMLLGQLGDQLGSRRLVVVSQGALQLIPLEALPVPLAKTVDQNTSQAQSRTYLIERNEVVVLPSVSALVAIRGRHRTSFPTKLVAVIADPVLSSNDYRVASANGFDDIALAASDDKDGSPGRTRAGLARLAHASEEADAISAVAPWGTTFVAKGIDANRETATSLRVGQYQIVHFATHGFLDGEHPELSGIVLSAVDQNGKATSGLMSLNDIYGLDLSSQLTVLSACQTALGKDTKGEGLVSLAHGFMSAGSNTVVASLWNIDDSATSLLMADFYELMLKRGMSPSAALRAAKLNLIREKRWDAPYYWAGFVLQGEYTNRINVARTSWFATALMLLALLIVVVVTLLIMKKRKRIASG